MKRHLLARLALVLGVITIGAQAPAGFDLALVDVNGTKQVLGRLPPSTYAPRASPDGKHIAFETRDLGSFPRTNPESHSDLLATTLR